ncbi:hypothetical protein CC2G_014534 [Coprinopsis cinerea AmutBmut pab1-1]|nr:hypothetical protein CC2G_014534 [Coprinopsis cinerea AmutBmut pab1-1]
MYQGRKKALQLFPSLHSVTVVCDSTCDYSSIFLAIRPTLEKVEIRGVGSSSPRDVQCIQQLLLALSLQATGLKHLALKGEGTEALAPTLFHVHTFKALSSLTIDLSSLAIPLAVLNGLRALRDLKSLTLFAGTTSATSSPLPLRQVTRGSPPLPDSLAFPTLMELNLHGSASGFLRALSVVDLGDVQKIELRIAEESDSHQWRDCFHLIAAGCRQLRSIKVTPSPCFRGSCHFSLPIIEPLLDILSLTHLNLNVTSLSFSNGLISTIASSFPNLKVLSLPSTPASEYPDLGCLKFLGACKRLQWARLCLRLNPDASSHGMVPNQSLTTLYIGDAVTQSLGIQDCLSIAEFLDLMFPSLVTLERVPVMSSRRGNHGHEQTFEDIKASLNVLRATRERVHASFLKQKEMEAADCSSRNQDSI